MVRGSDRAGVRHRRRGRSCESRLPVVAPRPDRMILERRLGSAGCRPETFGRGIIECIVDDTDQILVPGERRIIPSIVVIVLAVLPFLLPAQVFPSAARLGGPLAVGLLVAVIASDPGRIDRRSGLVRGLSIALTLVLVVVAAAAAVALVVELVDGAPDLQDAATLLTTGALVWIDVSLTFALLYWELDGGGPAGRLHLGRRFPELAFPEDLNPDLAVPGWQPTIVDYLYLAFTNATAFSPTDVMPMRSWMKMLMAVQASISLALLSLVIANAVNILG